MFDRKCQVQKWCDQTGVHFRHADGPDALVFHEGEREGSTTSITITHHDKRAWTTFRCNLPVRFPLDRTPDGLFARAMMRSIPLGYARWHMDILECTEATLYLWAYVPSGWMTPGIFAKVCDEMATEMRSFHKEIRDRFNWLGQSGSGMTFGEVRHHGGTGLPMLRPDNLPQRYR
jgi:hypothetical protein